MRAVPGCPLSPSAHCPHCLPASPGSSSWSILAARGEFAHCTQQTCLRAGFLDSLPLPSHSQMKVYTQQDRSPGQGYVNSKQMPGNLSVRDTSRGADEAQGFPSLPFLGTSWVFSSASEQVALPIHSSVGKVTTVPQCP